MAFVVDASWSVQSRDESSDLQRSLDMYGQADTGAVDARGTEHHAALNASGTIFSSSTSKIAA